MDKVVFSGHGGFELSTDPPWVTVPQGTTIYFYTDNLKALLDSNGQTVETMAAALDMASPSQVVYGGSSCLNYTLSEPVGLDIWTSPPGITQVEVQVDTTLGELLQTYQGDIYWAACRVVEFDREIGGEYLGVNDSQDALGGSDSSGDGTTDMASWLQRFRAADDDEREILWAAASPEWQHAAGLNDEWVRQWDVARTEAGSAGLATGEIDNFLEWWANAEQSERDAAWGDLTPEQQQQVYLRSLPAPDDAARAAITDINQETVKESVGDPPQLYYMVGGGVVLIGDRHEAANVDYVRAQEPHAEGVMTVERARIGAGDLRFAGVPAALRDAVKAEVARFSRKSVKFD